MVAILLTAWFLVMAAILKGGRGYKPRPWYRR